MNLRGIWDKIKPYLGAFLNQLIESYVAARIAKKAQDPPKQ